MRLAGRIAAVTGSTRGIGWAIAERLAADGAAVLVHGLEPDLASERAAALRDLGRESASSTADLAQPDGVERLRRDLETSLGLPDILVIAASTEILQGWRELTEEPLRIQTEVNLVATVRLLQAFLPSMLERNWGRVLAIGSVQEGRPNPQHFYYAATKAAQSNMILNLARTVRAPAVTFNVLKPGAILTDRNRGVLADEAYRSAVLARIPLGRIGAPDDCAAIAALLCSEEGSYINGAEIAVDGGLRL